MRFLLVLAAGAALAQTPPQQPNAAISGTVLDLATGRPLAGYSVSTYVNATYVGDTIFMGQAREVNAVSDEQGRYRLADLPPGQYRLTARNAQGSAGFAGMVTRHITLGGQDIDHIDFKMRVPGEIKGKVVDENREPLVGVEVYLVSREYYSGVLGYFFKSVARTDDRGQYVMKRVEAGHPYLLMVDMPPARLDAHSVAPLDPKLRRRALVRTFYPNSPDRQSASPVVVNPGETREGIDIEARKAPSLCVEGTLGTLSGPGAVRFYLEGAQPAFGTSSTGGMFGVGTSGITGADGKYRICGLAPGSYRLGASDVAARAASQRALAPFDIVDRDLKGLDLTLSPGMTIKGEVVWDGPAPAEPVETKVNVSLNPLLRAPIANERPSVRADIPGTFALAALLPTDYALRAFLNLPGTYVKDVTFAGKSILYGPLPAGAAAGDLGLRISLSRDAAKLSARVADKDGNPLPDMRVVVLPASIASEAMLQAAMVSGQTDNLGQYTSQSIAPGKYLVLATDDEIDATPECIDNLWRSRRAFQEVDLEPKGTAQVTLTPVKLRR